VQALFSPLAGRLSDRIEPRIVASIGMALTGVGLSLLAVLDEKTTFGFITASLVILGFGFTLFSSPTINAVMSSVENRFYGVASGTLGTMRGLLFGS
jgi:MFS family permease